MIEGPFGDTKRKAFTPADIRFTTRGQTLYAIVLAWPEDGRVTIRSLASGESPLAGEIGSVALVGAETPPEWSRDEKGLHVELPAERPSEHALALRITG